jgi:hypothetical protein
MTDAAETPPQEPQMEIHKPHAAKTWKEFFIELGTIVLGILIALSLEQSIEAIHDRGQARDAEAAIHEEIVDNANRLTYRMSHQACIEKRLDEVAGLLGEWADGKEFPAGLHIGFPGDIVTTDQRWQANLNSGRFSREAEATQVRQSYLYTALRILDARENEEQAAWSQLRALELGAHVLGPAYRPMVMQALMSARLQAFAIARLGPFFLANAKEINAGPDRALQPVIPGTSCEPLMPAMPDPTKPDAAHVRPQTKTMHEH